MDPAALETYLYEHIPLSKAMAATVAQADVDKVILHAPLRPNINHRDTVFGGSASALAILAAWALLYVRLQHAGIHSRVVIQRNTMQYQQAIPTDFDAVAMIEDTQRWQRFLHMLARKQRARISVTATLHCQGVKVGEMVGDFVALATLGVRA